MADSNEPVCDERSGEHNHADHGRHREKGQATLREIQSATGNDRLAYYNADFAKALNGMTGAYFDGTQRVRAHAQAHDEEARATLRRLSRTLTE